MPFRAGRELKRDEEKNPLILTGPAEQVTSRQLRPRAVRAEHLAPGTVSDRHLSGDPFQVNRDVEFLNPLKGVILQSPNGTRQRVTVDNSGDLQTNTVD